MTDRDEHDRATSPTGDSDDGAPSPEVDEVIEVVGTGGAGAQGTDGGTVVTEGGEFIGDADVTDHENTGETRNQKLQRNIGELLQELRVAQAGVQILFGFLLSVVFTQRFHDASGLEKALHLVAVLLAVAATALLTAPAAWHRLLFRTGRRDEILRVGNRVVLAGFECLAGSVTLTVALIAKVVYGTVALVVVGGLVLVLFGVLWFVVPLRLPHDDPVPDRASGPG